MSLTPFKITLFVCFDVDKGQISQKNDVARTISLDEDSQCEQMIESKKSPNFFQKEATAVFLKKLMFSEIAPKSFDMFGLLLLKKVAKAFQE